MGEYRISPRAERDLEEIWRYTESRWSAEQADRSVGALIEMIEELAVNPEKGRRIDDIRSGYRKQAAGSHYIFYRQARGSRCRFSALLRETSLVVGSPRSPRLRVNHSRPATDFRPLGRRTIFDCGRWLRCEPCS